MLVRSPTLTNRVSSVTVTGSRPESRSAAGSSGTSRGARPSTRAAMAPMCCGVVPQQPPTRLSSPESANSPTMAAVSSATSSYSPKALGSPALG